jgi:hypothetical protein
MNEILRGDNTMSSAESKKLMWFGHKIAAPLAGSRSKPSNSNFHARRAKGCTMRRRRD